jgi:hypothetical protein
VVELGAMLSRPGSGLRVVASHIPPTHLPNYLQDIDWRGHRDEITAVIAEIPTLIDALMLSMDLGNAVQVRLGLECFIDHRPERIHQWRVLLDFLQDVGLCTSTAARALLSWHGICQRGACPEPWLRNLDLGDRLLGPRAVSLFARFLSHIKLCRSQRRHFRPRDIWVSHITG